MVNRFAVVRSDTSSATCLSLAKFDSPLVQTQDEDVHFHLHVHGTTQKLQFESLITPQV